MAYLLDELTLEVEVPPGAEQLLEPLIGCLSASSQAHPDLRLRLLHDRPVERGLEAPCFVHGDLRCHSDGDGFRLVGAGADVRIAPFGAQIDASLDPGATEEARAAFARSTLVVATMVALRFFGRFHFHGGAVSLEDGTIALIAGNAGSGKSTATAALVEQGRGFLGDDTLLIREHLGRPVVAGVARPFHLDDRALRHLPRCRAHAGPPLIRRIAKRDVDVRSAFPGALIEAPRTTSVVLFPRVCDIESTRFRELAPAEALGGLIEASALVAVPELPGGEAQLELLGRVAAQSRSYAVDLGRDALEGPVLHEQLTHIVIHGGPTT